MTYKVSMADVIRAVMRERGFQAMKYPQTEPRSVSSHVLVMEQELFEAREKAVKGSSQRDDALREVLQVVACGIACLLENGLAERSYGPELLRFDLSHTPLAEMEFRHALAAADQAGPVLDKLLFGDAGT